MTDDPGFALTGITVRIFAMRRLNKAFFSPRWRLETSRDLHGYHSLHCGAFLMIGSSSIFSFHCTRSLVFNRMQATMGYNAPPSAHVLQVTVPPNAGPGSVLQIVDPSTGQPVQSMKDH